MIRHSFGKIDCYGNSRQHVKTERNADRYLVADFRPTLCVHGSSTNNRGLNRIHGPSSGQLLIVADGVGERRSAARASTLLVDTVNQHLLKASTSLVNDSHQRGGNALTRAFEDAIQECRLAMQQEIAAADRFQEMGAVITLAYVAWPKAIIMHIGNNRAFHWRRGALYQITTDHTMAGRLVEAGQLSHRRANESHLRHVVWNHVGTQTESTQPDYHELDLQVGDALVLYSNGMAESLENGHLSQVLSQTRNAKDTCRSIFDRAATRGYRDDATAIVARFCAARESTQCNSIQSGPSQSNHQTQSPKDHVRGKPERSDGEATT